MHYWADLQSVHGFRCYDNIAPNAKCQRVLVLALCLVIHGGAKPGQLTQNRKRCPIFHKASIRLICGVASGNEFITNLVPSVNVK